MPNAIDSIKKEHEQIEQYMQEIETIMKTNPINYPNLIHTFKEYYKAFEAHEKGEVKVIAILKKEGFKFPHERIDIEHGELKKHREAIKNAINSGSEFEVKKALQEHAVPFIEKIRKHTAFEDEIFYTMPLETFSEETRKALEETNNSNE